MADQKTVTRDDLMLGDDLENAITSAAEIKKNVMTQCKDQDKTTYDRFYETVLMTRPDVIQVMDKKRKNRDDADVKLMKNFKKETSRSYKMVCDYLQPEELEDGQLTKFEKLADKVACAVQFLQYIGNTAMDDAFKARGITLEYKKLDEIHENYSAQGVKDNISDIFKTGVSIKTNVKRAADDIKEKIYATKVPVELQFDKESNPLGITPSDWNKLVDLRAKLLIAKNDKDEQAKVEDKASDMAGEKQFEMERARLLQKKLMTMQAEETSAEESEKDS